VADARWRRHFPAPIYVGVPVEVAGAIAEAGDELPGIGVETQPMRYYPDSYSFAHVLGYVWTPNERDLERLEHQGVKPAAYVGKSGLEAFYEAKLVGQPGAEKYEMDAKRRPVRPIGIDPPLPGQQMRLTLDSDLQKLAMEVLRGRRGAVVALEPSTGDVLCFFSSPSFNTEPFGRGIREGEYKRLVDDEAHPLINRAFDVSSSFSPGSTFKPVTTMAAVQAGVFDPERYVSCPGYYEVGDRRIKCLGRHGSIRFREAMARSCNTYFADLAVRAGEDALRSAALKAGLGQRSGIDLRGEGKGIIPTEEWIKQWRKDGHWYTGDTVNMGIGQGETAATPLQMANLAALLANRGRIFRPHLVEEIVEPGGKGSWVEPQEMRSVSLDPQVWSLLNEAMVAVIEEGSGRIAQIPGLRWAGKTGSAEKRGQNLTNSWFIGYAPADNPRIAICVLGEAVGHGSDFAAPVAKQIVERYLAAAAK
jgi:penicillin-binding protein 2